jgi:hypothetical protein
MLSNYINDYGINLFETWPILYICLLVANITEFFNEIILYRIIATHHNIAFFLHAYQEF